MSGMAMAQIMEADARQLGRGGKFVSRVGDALRLNHRTVLSRAHERVVADPDAEPQKLLCLPGAPCPQFFYDLCRQSDGATAPRLRRLEADAGPRLLGALDDGKLCAGEVDMAPAHGGNLTAPESAQACQQGRHENPQRPRSLERFCHCPYFPYLHLASLNARGIDVIGRVAR